MTDKTLREAAQELVENKGPCLDGVVRHVGEYYVEALAAALADRYTKLPQHVHTSLTDGTKKTGNVIFCEHCYEVSGKPADSADAPEGPWQEGFAPPHQTVLARDAKGDLYQARVCYGMHKPFGCVPNCCHAKQKTYKDENK